MLDSSNSPFFKAYKVFSKFTLYIFRSMTNVDISETVIEQMTKQYQKTHPLMTFVAMDLLQLKFEAESFSCFLDKGTLDALMSDTNQESEERAEKLFKVFYNTVLLIVINITYVYRR